LAESFVNVAVTAVCMCGATWQGKTTMRAGIARQRRVRQMRMPSCPLCQPMDSEQETAPVDNEKENTDG
jgi:hypothetical protein